MAHSAGDGNAVKVGRGAHPGSGLGRLRPLAVTALASALAGGVLPATAPAAAGSEPEVDTRAQHLPHARHPEQRLLAAYRAAEHGRRAEALEILEALLADVPNFQLAQLAWEAWHPAGAVPLDDPPEALGATLDVAARTALDSERRLRQQAAQERPAAGLVPAGFVALPPSVPHAIAVDASRARVYLIENGKGGMRVAGDWYASIGASGVGKSFEGDQRTPLGVYHVTSRLSQRQVDAFYGAGALTLNYPNEYDRRLGRTGSGIWLHGVPADSYARAPLSSDGCVVLANDDLQHLLQAAQPGGTPVLIARRIEWTTPESSAVAASGFLDTLHAWRDSKARGDLGQLLTHYSPQFEADGTTAQDLPQRLRRELVRAPGGRPGGIELKDLTVLAWQDETETKVVTFGEVWKGRRTGRVVRQYWGREAGQWRIFYEGALR